MSLVELKNTSNKEVELELKTLDRTKGHVFVIISPGECFTTEEDKLTEQVNQLLREKRSRKPVLTATLVFVPDSEMPSTEDMAEEQIEPLEEQLDQEELSSFHSDIF